MGVLGLWGLLESVGHPINVQGLEGKVLGVDANIWLYKFIRGFREKDDASYSIESHKVGLFNRICKLLFYRIKPVFVFDGPAPVLKRRTLEKRQNFRNKHLSKVQDAAMKAIASQLKAQYPNANLDNVTIRLPELRSNYLAAAEKMTEEDDGLFYVPPHIRNDGTKLDKGDESSEPEGISSDEEEMNRLLEFDKEFGNAKIDIHSKEFLNLPAETRYEILQEVKEKSKRIRNAGALPENADSFSSFQLKRLKQRQQIQEKIEECEYDICANYAGELSDSKQVRAFRVQSDASNTLLYRINPEQQHDKKPFRDATTSDDSKTLGVDTESQSPVKSYRPSLKLLFSEEKKGSSYIRLPGTQISPKKSAQTFVSNTGPSLSPERDSDSSSSFSSVESLVVSKNDQPSSQAPSSIRKAGSSPSEKEDDDETDIESASEEQFLTCKQSQHDHVSSDHDQSQARELTQVTIDLETPKDELKSKRMTLRHSVVDLTDSVLSDDDQVEHVSDSEPPAKRANVTIEISDEEEWEEEEEKQATDVKERNQDNTETIDSQSTSKTSEIHDPICTTDKASPSDRRKSCSQPIASDLKQDSDDERAARVASLSQPTTSRSTTDGKTSNATKSEITRVAVAEAATATTAIDRASKDPELNAQRANKVTTKIIDDAKELLRLFGIPYIDAAGEAEAQCALLEELKLTEGTITDDSDIWLFGAQNVYRYFFSDDKYVMQYKMKDINFQLGMTREYLVCFAMLVGSDYTDGVLHVGPVTAIEILSEFEGQELEPLVEFSNWLKETRKDKTLVGNKRRKNFLKFNLPDEFPSRAVFDGYMRPVADSSTEQFSWGSPELDVLREYASRNFAWDQKKIDDKLVPLMKKLNEKKLQRTIDTFFFKTEANRNPELFRSKRVNQALNKIAKRTARGVKDKAPVPEEVNLSEDDD